MKKIISKRIELNLISAPKPATVSGSIWGGPRAKEMILN